MAKSSFRKLMSKPKFDGVVEGVRYTTDGQIDWVRAYERRGPTWSDHVLLDRAALIERLEAGKRFYIGQRIENQASEFALGEAISLQQVQQDNLKDVPAL